VAALGHPFRTAAVVLLGLYQAAAVVDSIGPDPGPLTRLVGDGFWPARWQMFTEVDHTASRARFEVSADGAAWTTFPLETYRPARWESGYRWERPALWKMGSFRHAWLMETCHYSGQRWARVVRERRKKVLGADTLAQPATDEPFDPVRCPGAP
jgi:hypothetical protein